MSKFAKFFMYLNLGLGTIHAVRQVEQAVAEPKQGPAKLDLVINSVSAAAMSVPEIAAELEHKDVQAFSGSIATTAAIVLNGAGIFKKS